VLARLDAIPGVQESRVEAGGRYFLLVLAPGADEARVLAGAAEALRGRARRLGDAAAAAQLASRGRGDPWLAAAEVQALSYVEARIVAARAADAVAPAAGLDRAARDALAEAARVEVFRAIERVHDEGGRESSGWFNAAWPAIAAAVAARLEGTLPPHVLARVARALGPLHEK
jgi:hypothetical protein